LLAESECILATRLATSVGIPIPEVHKLFGVKGRSVLFLVHSSAEDKIIS